MAKINLLPWREERRKERQRQFLLTIVAVVLVAGILFLGAQTMVSNSISSQQNRNIFLQGKISELDKKIKEIKELQERREQLEERMNVIQSLQGDRPIVVHQLDELPRRITDGMFFSSVEKQGNLFKITGIAESNNRISKFMRSIDESEWFSSPNLSSVKAASESIGEVETSNQFNLTFSGVKLKTQEEGG